MTKFLAIGAVIGLLSAGTGWMATGAADTTRPDCPGKIVCPLTGDEVCADRCPVADQQRSDCPGKVECPVTSEPICADRCPADPAEAKPQAAVPPCCR